MPNIVGQHLLGIAGLTREQVDFYLHTSQQFVEVNEREVKKVPTLRGKTVVNLFLEPSTRTRTSFEIAGKRLSAEVINVSGKDSSVTKGETLIDTVMTLEAMAPDILVMRHPCSGTPQLITKYLKNVAVINAGDGLHEHPTQALFDTLTIKQHFGRVEGLKILFVGDVFRSRVARSNILLHKLYGNEIRVVAPPTLAVKEFEELGAKVYHEMSEALKGVDVVMSLRMKHEYLKDQFIPSLEEYTRKYYINEKILAEHAPNCVVLAPGPYIRGVEIDSTVIDGPRSLYKKQVFNAVAVRMAALFLMIQNPQKADAENYTEDTVQ
ncbi:MAG: aspartate carbamoyltransferase catalytic subunit [Proteobacteria bacterium]|nr:aspartate carbamoyltransferase catalytic subunit [Pseudomonadota bacterium]